jgi:hypothetical protein
MRRRMLASTNFWNHSRLGLDLEPDTLAANLAVTTIVRSRQDTTSKPGCGERDVVRDCYDAVQIDLEEKAGHRRSLRLTFRVYDEGAGFCYVAIGRRS